MNQADGRTSTEWLDFFKEGPFNIAEACLKIQDEFRSGFIESVYQENLELKFEISGNQFHCKTI